ncbi:MAG TPA: TPM domain-containing protein [Clostridiales bacterium]|nr:TPM domain-containing protein [Clostridiales bacterium]
MKVNKFNYFRSIPFLLVFFVLMLYGSIISSASNDSSKGIPHIEDRAKLLTNDELSELESNCIKYGDDVGIGIYILTHNDKKAVFAEQYIEEFYDNKLYSIQADSVILLIDMHNRDVFIEGYGITETYIHSNRGDEIIAKITPLLSDENYSKAISTFIKMSHDYMNDDSELNFNHDYTYETIDRTNYANQSKPLYANIFFQIFISIIIATISILTMIGNSSGKTTVNNSTYLDNSKPGLIGKRDRYVTTRVTRVKKPDPPTSSGSSGRNSSGYRGGSSGGGRSHSSSGGKF